MQHSHASRDTSTPTLASHDVAPSAIAGMAGLHGGLGLSQAAAFEMNASAGNSFVQGLALGDGGAPGPSEGHSATVGLEALDAVGDLQAAMEQREAGGVPAAPETSGQALPTAPAGSAQAGVLQVEFNSSAFQSMGALGYIDMSGTAAPTAPPIAWSVPKRKTAEDGSSEFSVYITDPWTQPRDPTFPVKACPAGTYDTGKTVQLTVNGARRTVKQVVEVTAADAAKVAMFEQQHIDDTVAAYGLVYPELAQAIEYFRSAGVQFRGASESAAQDYGMGRILDHVGSPKVGRSPEEWTAAYKKLLALTISQRDDTGTHTWAFDRSPTVSADGTTATYHLLPPSGAAGPSWTVVG
jgi:hypothetical protein